MLPSKLNPHARAFVMPSSEPQSMAPADASPGLMDLPPELLSAVLSFMDVKSLASSILSSKALKEHAADAPLSLDLSVSTAGGHGACGDAPPGRSTSANLLVTLPKYMPSAVRLNLSGQALEDADVTALVARLPRLQHLELASCRKVTCQLGTALVRASAAGQRGAPPSRLPLRALNLQRCFQMRCSALSELLHGVRAGLLPFLGALAMIHLDLTHLSEQRAGAFPHEATSSSGEAAEQEDAFLRSQHGSPSSVSSSSSSSSPSLLMAAPAVQQHGSAVRVLALNNCGGVNLQALATLATLCPHLEYLMLGGGTWLMAGLGAGSAGGGGDVLLAAAAASSAAPAATADVREAVPGPFEDVLTRAAALVPELREALRAHGQGWGLPGGGPTGAAQAASQRLCGSRAPRGTPLAADAPWMVEVAAALAAVLLQLPRLRAVELTFFPPPVLSRVAAALALLGGTGAAAPRLTGAQQRDAPPAELWDLSLALCVERATQALLQAAGAGGGAEAARHGACLLSAPASRGEALRLALRCAANCSNTARATPLHAAAERGDERALRGLLALGAGVDTKERGGAAPLFLAAEAGHVACVSALLEARANPQVSNAAGEVPLYIAALKGHLPVVRLLLAHCHAHDIAWQDASLYGDRFSPLMAAAVADRVDVAQALLRAAGGPSPAAASLVGAVNRYGQCVLHIAARKASGRLLRLLLSCSCCSCSCTECTRQQHQHHEQHEEHGCSALAGGAIGEAHGQPGQRLAHAHPCHHRLRHEEGAKDAVPPAPGRPTWPSGGPHQHHHHHQQQQQHNCAVVLADSNGDTPLDVARKNRNSGALAELTRGLQQLSCAAPHHPAPGSSPSSTSSCSSTYSQQALRRHHGGMLVASSGHVSGLGPPAGVGGAAGRLGAAGGPAVAR